MERCNLSTARRKVKERLLGRADEVSISAATVERPFSFDGDGAAFQLTCEAKRIDLAPRQPLTRPARPIASVPVHPRSPQHEGFLRKLHRRGLKMIRIFPCFGLGFY